MADKITIHVIYDGITIFGPYAVFVKLGDKVISTYAPFDSAKQARTQARELASYTDAQVIDHTREV